MSQVDFETFWPFEQPGRQANMARWRRMGRLWLHNGVVQGVGEQFPIHGGGWNPAEGRILIGTGAAFIEGFYGATENWTWVSTPGNDGMVKARLDPGAQTISLAFENWHGYHSDPWAAHGIVEIPLFEVWPDGRSADRRQVVSPDIVQGLETIPEWVPQGRRSSVRGPAGEAEVAVGSNAVQMSLDSMPGFAPGRTYRVSGFCEVSRGTGWSQSWAHLMALWWPDNVAFRDARVARPLQGPGAGPVHGWSEFVLPHVPASLMLAIQVRGDGGGFGNCHFTAGSCYIEVTDLGI